MSGVGGGTVKRRGPRPRRPDPYVRGGVGSRSINPPTARPGAGSAVDPSNPARPRSLPATALRRGRSDIEPTTPVEPFGAGGGGATAPRRHACLLENRGLGVAGWSLADRLEGRLIVVAFVECAVSGIDPTALEPLVAGRCPTGRRAAATPRLQPSPMWSCTHRLSQEADGAGRPRPSQMWGRVSAIADAGMLPPSVAGGDGAALGGVQRPRGDGEGADRGAVRRRREGRECVFACVSEGGYLDITDKVITEEAQCAWTRIADTFSHR